MRARGGIDRLSGMDVRAATRRTRLPVVASLLLAALLGVPATVEAAPVAAQGVVASPSAVSSTEAQAPAGESTIEAAVTTVVAAFHADVPSPGPALTDQVDRAALAPRAPPTA
jgi:hypothetical protein